MNKKFLLCGVIAATLIITACTKKETPPEQPENTTATEQNSNQEPAQPVEFENLESAEEPQAASEAQNSTAEVVPAPRPAPAAQNVQAQPQPKPQAQPKPVEPTPKPQATEYKPVERAQPAVAEDQETHAAPKPSNAKQSQEDAVAAAIAAATPAIEN